MLIIIIIILKGMIAEFDHDEDGSINLIEWMTEGEASSVDNIGDFSAGDGEYEVSGLSWNGVTNTYRVTIRSSQPPVDIKTKVAYQYNPSILKCNFCFHVNGRLGTT